MRDEDDIQLRVDGECAEAFTPLKQAFIKNFTERDEIGAAVCVYIGEDKVVDMWGGHRDQARTKPWGPDTLCVMYSIAKSMGALCVHMLADRGEIKYDEPVATYWPEFAGNGKENILVKHVLSHHCGVCFNDHAKPGDIFDPAAMEKAIEAQEPAWPPGTKGAYNTVNIGYIFNGLVLRVDGRTTPEFLQQEICEPLSADYKIGLNEEDLKRVADITPNPENAMFNRGTTQGTPLQRAWQAMPEGYGIDTVNSREYRTGQVLSFGGHGTARGVAKIYAMLANLGEIDGVRLLSPKTVARLQMLQWENPCGTTGRPYRMAMGFFKNSPGYIPMGPNMNAFGHLGSGGALAFVDPEPRITFAACTNFQADGEGVGKRTEALVTALYDSVRLS